jgi:subtilisin-like proprotein convertase family protein
MKLLPPTASHNRRVQEQGIGREQRKAKKRSRLTLEQLEVRELLAIVPGPNVNISQRPLNQVEGTIAIDRTDPTHLFAAATQETQNGFLGAFSTDSGVTWNPDILGDGTPASDNLPLAEGSVSATFDDFGNLFVAYVSQGLNQTVIANSTDGGQTFNVLAQLDFFVTQPTIATGPGFATPGSVWVMYSQFGTLQVVGAPVAGLGLVGGFSAAVTPPGGDQLPFFGDTSGDIAVGPNGQVLVTYEVPEQFCFGDQPGDCEGPGTIFTNVDPDGLGAQPFSRPVQVTTTNVGSFDFIPAQPNRGVGAEPGIVYDRTGGLNDGRAYFVYTDETFDESNDTDIFVMFSDNDGASWSTPLQVNDDTTSNSQFLPRIALDPTTGDVAVTWYDSRNDAGLGGPGDTDSRRNTDAQLWGTASSDGGVTFEASVQISEGTSNANASGGAFDYGDYAGLDFFGGSFYPIWADNSTTLPNSGSPIFDVATAQVFFQDTTGPFVIAVDPLTGAAVDGPVDFIEFTFNEAMDTTSFSVADVITFNVTDTLGVTSDLISSITGFAWTSPNVLQLQFNPQGPAGTYSITIGPGITDDAGNAMDQDKDGNNGEAIQDRFTTDFTITNLQVINVQVFTNSVIVNFSKAVEPGTISGGTCPVAPGDTMFIESSGGDFAFAGDPGNTIADVCVQTLVIQTAPDQVTLFFLGNTPTDLYRLQIRSGGLTDEAPMNNPLDGEFDGPPTNTPPGNNNTFPSGDGVVGGDFVYEFVTGDTPTQAPSADVLPPSIVTGTPVILPSTENASGVTIAQHPTDATHLVAVWTANDVAQNPVFTRVQAAFSVNGGQTWNSINGLEVSQGCPGPALLCNPNTTNPTVAYPESTDGSVAIDRNGNVYILTSQHTTDFASGALVLQKFNFNGSTPSRVATNEVIYQWVGDPAFNPTIVVDDTLGTFTDPESGVTVTNPWAGNVYVAWNTQNAQQANLNNPNPNVILLAVSSDGGSSFGPANPVNDGSFCFYNPVAAPVPPQTVQNPNCGINNTDGEFDTMPRLVVSQGTADGRVAPGQINIVWDDFGSRRRANPASDLVISDAIPDGGLGFSFTGNGGFLNDAFDPGNSQPHITATTRFQINVNLNDPRFVSLTDIDVTVDMTHNTLSEVSLVLIPPPQSGFPSITLAPNRINAAGTSNNNIGMTGTGLGVLNFFDVGAIFDQDAARSIFVGASPYVGRFRPQGGDLDDLNGMTLADVNGTWTLEVNDFRQSNITAPPFPVLDDWSISFSSGMTTGVDTVVATTVVRGTANGPFPRTVPASPNRGIAPAPVIASDNTLGSFSPYQGRLYVAYTTIGNTGNNSNVVVATSDDGGLSWSSTFGGGVVVNDDNALDGSTGTRSQFNPAVVVDQVTGTVVMAWLDARDDAANARTATYMSTSIDGGQTWSKNVFLNRPHTTEDGYDLSTRIYGPIPDNQSGGNSARNARFNFGDHIGLVASAGEVVAAWPGNENVTPLGNPIDCCTTEAFVARASIAAGPRVISSTMGWVDAPANVFDVTFDRLVDPATFTATAIAPHNMLLDVDFEGGLSGFVIDNSGGTPSSADDGLWHLTTGRGQTVGHSPTNSVYFGVGEGPNGRGSYTNGVRGTLTSPVIDLTGASPNVVLRFNNLLSAQNFFDHAVVNVIAGGTPTRIADNDSSRLDNLPDQTIGFEPVTLNLSAFVGQTIQVQFSFDSDASVTAEGWYIDDVRVEDLGVPGDVRVWGRDVYGEDFPVDVVAVIPTSCNPIGCDQFRVVFDPQDEVGTYRLAVGPDIRDRIRLDAGFVVVIPGPTFSQSAVAPNVPRRVPPFGTGGSGNPFQDITNSDLNFNAAPPGAAIADVNVTLNITHTYTGDLAITLIHPDGTRVALTNENIFLFNPNFDNQAYINTTFDDQAPFSVATATPPITGSWQPVSPLSVLQGKTADGNYRLEVRDAFGADFGFLNSWSLTIQTGTVVGTSNVRPGNFMDQNGNATADEPPPIDSPPLFNSATRNRHDAYLSPQSFDDTDTLPLQVTGPRVAPDLGAKRVGAEYSAIDPSITLGLPLIDGGIFTRTPALSLADGATTTDTINVPGSFSVSDLNVRLNITHARVDDLDIVLRHVPSNRTITLVADAPSGGANFTNTTFDDESAARIQSSTNSAPYTGTFRPRDPLSSLDGINAQGNWRLEITDDTGNGIAGVLNSWTLDFGVESKFTIDDHFPITDLDAFINLSSSNLSDLRVELTRDDNLSTIDYDPTTIVLFDAGDASGTTMNRTVFSDEAAAGVAPGGGTYRSTFRPDGFLGLFDDLPGTPFGQSGTNGVWKLRVTDVNGNGSTGTLNNWGLIVNPTLRVLAAPGTVLADNGTVTSTISVTESFIVSDVNVQVSITHPHADELDLVLVNLATGISVPLVTDVVAGGSNFTNTIFADESPTDINNPSNVAPYVGYFRPETPLSNFNGIDGQGGWQLVVTDDTQDLISGILNNWSIDFGQSVQSFDRLDLHGAANYMDFRFDRDMDPSTFTTVDVNRIIGPAGQVGSNPLGPFRYATLDTTPNPVPIPDSGQVNSTIAVRDSFVVGDVDVLVEINHPNVTQLHLFLVGPTGTRVELVDNLTVPSANLVNTIFDDEGSTPIVAATAPYAGHFRPTQLNGLSLFDGSNSAGTWTLEINDEGVGGTGTLVRWNLVLTKSPNQYFSTLPSPLVIPDNGAIVTNSITVPQSYPIQDVDVTLNITHPRVQDLEVTLIGPDGTRVPLVANLPATGGTLSNTAFDDEAANVISTGESNAARCAGLSATAMVNPNPSCSTRFRPVLQQLATDRVSQLSDFDGLNAQGNWTLEIRDRTSGNLAGPQLLNSWSLAITASEFRILPNPDGTDPNPNFPRTYRVYFPRQVLSGTYAVSLAPNILSQEQSAELRCFPTGVAKDRSACGLDTNRNAGLEALRRGDGFANDNVVGVDLRPGGLDTAVDFQSLYDSRDVGDAVSGRPIPEPIAGAARPITSRIVIPDNVIISDLNVRLTITNQQPPGTRPLMRDDDYDVFLISPSGTRLELFTDVGGAGVDFVDLFLNDEATRCQKSCQPVYIQDSSAPFSDDFRPEQLKPSGPGMPEGPNGLKLFDGEQARGVWTLEITDDTANGLTASLRSWSIEVSGRTTGLAEYAADQISSSFRIFVMDPGDPRSSTGWTAVGPANDNGVNDASSRAGAIAVDPSDPTGNTVFVAGATGGVWKTTNFLTTDPAGPTYVPLTDFAPTLGLHIGSIALFPRNNDPKQTVVYVATGEADAGFTGVGFLKSEDGGATWRLQDSLHNDQNIPFVNRDHTLSAATTAFKVVIDPTFPDGRVVYAALSGLNGGLYKTTDGGINWTNTRPGQASDVVLDLVNTEVVYAAFRGEGVFISSDRGAQWQLMAGGINNAQVRDIDVPGISNGTPMPIGAPQGTPNGGKGRISLAKPALLGDAVLDRAYEGRLYAVVSTPPGGLDGVYMTSDFGANWTKLELGRVAGGGCPAPPPPTNDDTNNVDIDIFNVASCTSAGGQGNYDQAIIVDPQNPNRVYVFGTGYPENPVIAVDVALTYDGHNYTIFDHDNGDGGQTELDTVGGAIRKLTRDNNQDPPFCEPFACRDFFVDFDGDRQGPNLSEAGLYRGVFNNIASFANNGFETRWTPMLISRGPFLDIHVDYHDVAAIVDPLTGKTRLIVGSDGGVYTALTDSDYDVNGKPRFSDYATAFPPSPSIGNSIGPDSGSRNGNLQQSQMYGGATQPSQIAAEIAALVKGGGMFYGAFQDNGASKSDPLILENGNIAWTAYFLPEGDAGYGLTTSLTNDDSTIGDAYIYLWPCCGGNGSDVIRLNNEPRVTGLDQDLVLLPAAGPFDFYINYRDSRELLFSGPSGRLYKTDDAGLQWLQIAAPSVFSAEIATSAAFGAEQPDPNPNDVVEPDETIFVGLPDGRLFVSLNEGGDNGQEWFDISFGLNRLAVEDIAPNIRQFSNEVFLVTTTGVFWMPEDPQPDARICRYPGRNDIIPGGDAPVKSRLLRSICDVIQAGPGANVTNPWVDITGNLRGLQQEVFPGAWNGEGALGPINSRLPLTFSSIKVDDRYQIPDATGQRSPLVYVASGSEGGGSGAGVYRTFDHGQTWRRFPDPEIDGAPIQGGYLPTVNVSEIDLSVGPYDPQTGLSDFSLSLDLLVAHTYGRGTFAVRSAPLIFTAAGGLVSNSPDLLDADDSVPPVPPFPPSAPGSPYTQDNITNHDGSPAAPLHFTGLTHRGATVRLLEDNNGVLTEVGRGLADFFTGDWTVAVGDTDADGTPDGLTLGCGQHVIRAQGISASGTVGQVSDPLTITVLNEPPVELFAPDLLAIDDTGVSSIDNITRINTPRFSGATFCGGSGEAVPQAIIRLMVRDPLGSIVDPNDPNPATNHYRTVGLASSGVDGSWTVQVDSVNFGPALADGNYVFVVRAEDLAGNIGPLSPTINVRIDTQVTPAPNVTTITLDTCAPLASLPPTLCTFGSRTDLITADQTLILGGVSEPNSTVTLRFVGGAVLSNAIAADGAGNWSFDHTGTTLAPGSYNFAVSAIDLAGNSSPLSSAVLVVVDTSIAQPSIPDLVAASDTGASSSDNITNDDTPTFTGTAEALSQIQFMDGATPIGLPVVVGNDASDGINGNGLGSWTFTSPSLPCAVALGCSHNFSVVATDRAGNVSIASPVLTVTIDTIAPASPPSTPDLDAASDSANACPPPSGNNTDNYTNVVLPTFTGTAEPNSIVTLFEGSVRLGTATVGPNNGTGVGNWTFTVGTPLTAGAHTVFARTTDLAGNDGPSSGSLTVTVDVSVAAPSAPDLSAASDTGNSNTDNLTSVTTLTFTGTSEAAPGNGCVEVSANPTGGGGAISLGFASADAAGNWTLVTSVALADGTYSVTARTTDRAGNVSGNSTPMTPNLVIDRTPPTAPTTPDLTANSDTGISNTDNITRDDTPTFTGNATVGTRVELFRDCNTVPVSLGNPVSPAGSGLWTFTSPSLSDGTYAICATATDAAGNRSSFSSVLTIVIDTVIAQPLAPDLDPLSDTGRSSTDDITRDNTPTFTNPANSAEANSTLSIFDGANPVSTVQVTANGSWTFTVASPMVDGVHSITVRAVDVAGNQSQFSLALSLTIDTQIATPIITGITEDRGPSSSDHNTNDPTLVFRGTAEANSTVVFSQTGIGVLSPCPVPSPSVVADVLGNWSFDNTCRSLPEGNFGFTVTATDVAGNTSGVSAVFGVIIDTTAPGSPAGTLSAPTLVLADDTGVQGDNITRLNRPRLTGTVTGTGVGNIQVEILSASNTVLGSTRTAANGTYTVQFTNSLFDGLQNVSVRATDDAGNVAQSPTLAFTVDATAPRILSFAPNGSLTTTTSQLTVQFTDDALNQTLSGDPAFNGSVRNLANYRLVGPSGTFDLSRSDFAYDTLSDRLVITLRNSSGNVFSLPNGNWQFTINGTTSLQDVAGNRIDGENLGTFPTGNGTEGGDFVATFAVNVPPASITDIHMAGTKRVVSQVIINFSQPLDRQRIASSSAFHLIDAGRDKIFDTADDIPISLGLPVCNAPVSAPCTTVTVKALRGQSLDRFFLLTIDRSIVVDVGGNPISASSARHFVGRGRKLSYNDSNGDFVTVSLVGGGLMDVVRGANGEGRFIHIERAVPNQSAIPGKSSLTGTVTQKPSGDGVTHFESITGTNGINLNGFPRPPFIVPPGQISALVVDRLLDDGDSVSGLIADDVVSVLARRAKHRS